MLGVLLSWVWDQRTVIFQLSGFYCRSLLHRELAPDPCLAISGRLLPTARSDCDYHEAQLSKEYLDPKSMKNNGPKPSKKA